MADLSITHDPWRVDATVHEEDVPEAVSRASVRKGKQRETRDDEERGVWARLGTMERLSVLSKVVDSSNGRDKVLKSCQYAAKAYTFLFVLVQRSLMVHAEARDKAEHVRRLDSAAGSLSLARKCLRLFGPIPHLNALIQPTPHPASTFFNTILALLTACADDVFCLSRLGLVSKRTGGWADKWANRFWFLKSVMELMKLHLRRVLVRALFPGWRRRRPSPAEDVDSWERDRQELWTARKLLCDVVFSGYNVFKIQRFREPVQIVTGLTAGLISTSQLFRKEEVRLFKALQ
ncbi:hypothetical protein NCC49_004017 [Naganishia albida]|nr:hypothetical protein NCC49_004017 [Naganishia albida]